MTLSVNGREYPTLHIIDYEIKLETLDGESTGRSKAYGWPMIRDPQGYITNLVLEFTGIVSNSSDFVHLWNICKSMGSQEFATVKFVDPLGSVITQEMYLSTSELRYKRITIDNVVYTNALTVNFIAKKGV